MARPQLTDDEIFEFREAACLAALEIIGDQGVGGLTVRSLGERLGCSYSKPYRYFGDKDQLIDAVRAHAFDRFDGFMAGADPEAEGLEPMQRYACFARNYSAAFEVMFGFNQAYVSPETRAAEDRAWQTCTRQIYEWVGSGELVGDPEKIAHVLWVSMHGLSTLALANKLTHGMSEEEVLAELPSILEVFRP